MCLACMGSYSQGGNAIRSKRKPPPEPSESRRSKRQAVGKKQEQLVGPGATEEPLNPPVVVEEQPPAPHQVLSELVGRKLSFKKGCNVTKKVEMMGGFIKELRGAGEAMLEECVSVKQELEEWKGKAEEEKVGRSKDKEGFEKERLNKEAEARDVEERLNMRLKESREALAAKHEQVIRPNKMVVASIMYRAYVLVRSYYKIISLTGFFGI